MKMVLVQCPAGTSDSPAYALALLSAVLREKGYEVKCFDLNIELFQYCQGKEEAETWSMDDRGNCWYDPSYVEKFINKYYDYIQKQIDIILAEEAQVIGFSVQSTSRHLSLEIARLIKEKDKNRIIVFGGPQCFKNCEYVSILGNSWIDAICYGEGEKSLIDFLEYIRLYGEIGNCPGFAYRDTTGNIIECEEAVPVEDLDIIPFADYSDFNLTKYTKTRLPILTSRGCPNRCTFCNESPHWKRYRVRSAQRVYDEMIFQQKQYPAINEFWFNDSLINGNIPNLELLCDLFINNEFKIQWGGQTYIRDEMSLELLEKMKRAGCNIISYGLESGSNNILKLMRKGYSAELAEKVIRDTYKTGMYIIFNIVVGYPGETEKDSYETAEFLRRNVKYVKVIALNMLLLLKGSYLYEHAEKLDICFPKTDAQLCWYTKDGKNTYDIRLQRLALYKEIVSGKLLCTRSDADTQIETGDLMLETGDLEKAIDCYLKARELNANPLKTDMIEDKILCAKESLKKRI